MDTRILGSVKRWCTDCEAVVLHRMAAVGRQGYATCTSCSSVWKYVA